MKDLILKIISGAFVFCFIGISIYELINEYTYSIGNFPITLFNLFLLFYIIHFSDYVRLIIDIKKYRTSNIFDTYKPTKESIKTILYCNLKTIAMTTIYLIPTTLYAYHTKSVYNFIRLLGNYLIFAMLLNDMLVQMIKEKTTIRQSNEKYL